MQSRLPITWLRVTRSKKPLEIVLTNLVPHFTNLFHGIPIYVPEKGMAGHAGESGPNSTVAPYYTMGVVAWSEARPGARARSRTFSPHVQRTPANDPVVKTRQSN